MASSDIEKWAAVITTTLAIIGVVIGFLFFYPQVPRGIITIAVFLGALPVWAAIRALLFALFRAKVESDAI